MAELDITSACNLLETERFDEALRVLTNLAASGSGWAHLYLGWMNQQGLGLSVDQASAETHFLQAKDAGVPEANYYLGRLYRSQGKYEEAFKLLEGAGLSGNPSGAYWAYVMCQDGKGIPRNEMRAAELLELAVSLGHVFARRDLAKKMARGALGLREVPKGLAMLVSNAFKTAHLAASNLEDMRLR